MTIGRCHVCCHGHSLQYHIKGQPWPLHRPGLASAIRLRSVDCLVQGTRLCLPACSCSVRGCGPGCSRAACGGMLARRSAASGREVAGASCLSCQAASPCSCMATRQQSVPRSSNDVSCSTPGRPQFCPAAAAQAAPVVGGGLLPGSAAQQHCPRAVLSACMLAQAACDCAGCWLLAQGLALRFRFMMWATSRALSATCCGGSRLLCV